MQAITRAAFRRKNLLEQRSWIDRFSSYGHQVGEAVRLAQMSGDASRAAEALRAFRTWQAAMVKLMEWAVEEATLSSYDGLDDLQNLSLATMAQDLEVAWWAVHQDDHQANRARHQDWLDRRPTWDRA